MAETRRLAVDLGDLCLALEDASLEHTEYLDLETGELLFVSDYMDDAEKAALEELLEDTPERYEPVPRADSSEGYRDMEGFIALLDDERLGELLEVAIAGRGAFRRFKEVLARFPAERERWFRFKDGRLRERALEWLAEIGVEPT